MSIERIPTGVRRLDELLKGGLPVGNFALLHGPPFIGKEVLARQFFLSACEGTVPSVMVLTNHAAADLRSEFLNRYNSKYSHAEEQGLLNYVDAYTRAIGNAEPCQGVRYVDSLMDLNDLSATINEIESKILPRSPTHRLVFDSVSTICAYTNPQTTFRFLQVFLGRARRAGATGMILLDDGMHTEAEVRMFRHLADGIIEVKEEGGKHLLHIDGLGSHESHGWVEYRFDETRLEITGSFAAGRIR